MADADGELPCPLTGQNDPDNDAGDGEEEELTGLQRLMQRLMLAKERKQEEARAAAAAAGEPAEELAEDAAPADSAALPGLPQNLVDALPPSFVSAMQAMRASKAGGSEVVEDAVPAPRAPLMESFDAAGVGRLLREGKATRVVVMCGAGISVSAGIPDFRSPGTGLYDNLQKYDLPHPQAVFELDYFRDKPEPFYQLARELYPGRYLPTPAHHFIRLLHDKGVLLRCFTQNIDSLERAAGLPSESYVAAHGNFDGARCIGEGRHVCDPGLVKEAVDGARPLRCAECGELVKPDIVFFGEDLPARFHELVDSDMDRADLLIVMGTSLAVMPFASLVHMVSDDCPRALVNRDRVCEANPALTRYGMGQGFDFTETNYRDAPVLGDCDDGVRAIAAEAGWAAELEALCAAGGL